MGIINVKLKCNLPFFANEGQVPPLRDIEAGDRYHPHRPGIQLTINF